MIDKIIKILLPCLLISFLLSNVKIPIYNVDVNQYISVNEYVLITNADSKFHVKKKKLDLKFHQQYNIKLSQNSSFIMIDSQIYHSYLQVLYKDDDFLIPITPFLNIINGINQEPLGFIDTLGEHVILDAESFNINNIDVISKSNGTIIKVNTVNQFNSNLISAAITKGGWLNLTIPGGIVDSLSIVSAQNIYPVQRVRCIQYNESCQISFLIRENIDEFDISSTQDYININLRMDTEQNAQKIKKMREKWLLDTIVIDAGHGGRDPGAIGIGGLQEKTVTLESFFA